MNGKQNDLFDNRSQIEDLFSQSKKYRTSEGFIKFIKFIASFDHYSRFNCMLVYLQNDAVTFFGSKSFWKKRNRKIIEDARPYLILAPKHPIVLVYDIFDTEGILSPKAYLENGLGRDVHNVEGHISQDVYVRAINTAQKWGIKIKYYPMSYFKEGYIMIRTKLKIGLKEGVSKERNFKTLLHELAHLFLGHTSHDFIFNSENDKSKQIELRSIPRRIEEIEAETVSYLLCSKRGLEGQSIEYIATWFQSEEDFRLFNYSKVIQTADQIERMFFKGI